MNFPIEIPDKHLQKAEKLRVFPDDIEESFIRGSGAGGQKINKTNSCVHLKHLPTGIEVKVQKHRERGANRLSAYKLLIDKIEDRIVGKKSERSKKQFKIRKQKARRTKKAKEKILANKKHRASVKRSRSKVTPEEE